MTSGIYCFKHNEKPFIYIGSSVNVEVRYEHHLQDFNNNKHTNLALQKDFLKQKLSFDILAKGIPKDGLLKMEQFYCEQFLEKGYLLYNKVLPRPLGYDNSMLCSQKYFDDQVNAQLEVCYNYINSLNRRINELKQELGYTKKRESPNIFYQIEEYGEIKEW